MANASIGGYVFRVNPSTVSWPFTVKTAEKATVGGKVVQVLGVELGDLVVGGAFGKGGWREQTEFIRRMQALAERQVYAPKSAPIQFRFPSRGWDFSVYIKEVTQPGSISSATYANEIINPPWQLTLFIVEDNSPIKISTDNLILNFMRRLSAGLGWQQTEYNGPMDAAAILTESKEYYADVINRRALDEFDTQE